MLVGRLTQACSRLWRRSWARRRAICVITVRWSPCFRP